MKKINDIFHSVFNTKYKKIAIIVFIAIFAMSITAFAYIYQTYNYVDIDDSDENLGINKELLESLVAELQKEQEMEQEKLQIRKDEELIEPDVEEKKEPKFESKLFNSEDYLNFAVFGVDRRAGERGGRSDALMIGSFNVENKTFKIASIMRDLRVNIPGRGLDKIAHAYAYGGPELQIKTLNKNFGLDINRFVTFDFDIMVDVINLVGGVEIELTQAEINQINNSSSSYGVKTESNKAYLSNPGVHTLNGAQALAYSRIRKIDSDFSRTERQRKVLEQVLFEVMEKETSEMIQIINTVIPHVETNFRITETIDIMTDFLAMDKLNFKDSRFPKDNNYNGGLIGKTYFIRTNEEQNKRDIINFLYIE